MHITMLLKMAASAGECADGPAGVGGIGKLLRRPPPAELEDTHA